MNARSLVRVPLALRARARERRRLAGLARRAPELQGVIEAVKARNLTFLGPEALADLAEAVIDLRSRGVTGAVLEAGTALGGSAVVLATAKERDRPLWVYDAFGMIPAPSENDGADTHARYAEIVSGASKGIGDGLYYGYRDDLFGEVTATLTAFGLEPSSASITLVKGYYEDTLHVDYPVALAHVDCDWYESVMTCLREIEPHLVAGGRFVIDDYNDWEGCRRAVDEFFAGRDDYVWEHRSRLHLVKT